MQSNLSSFISETLTAHRLMLEQLFQAPVWFHPINPRVCCSSTRLFPHTPPTHDRRFVLTGVDFIILFFVSYFMLLFLFLFFFVFLGLVRLHGGTRGHPCRLLSGGGVQLTSRATANVQQR